MIGIIREELGMMQRDFTIEVVALREEIGVLQRDFTTEVVTLRDEIGVLRRALGELHTEVAALRDDVAGFRGSVRGSVGETGVPRYWWATVAGFAEFFDSVPEPEREGVEVGSEVPEEARIEVLEEAGMIEGVERETGVPEGETRVPEGVTEEVAEGIPEVVVEGDEGVAEDERRQR
ncbi:Hypothetical predicted protein [Olea europaea subsp. europaea]|uniref:Uncharacterized protein n=1 Tax=Olea europaea subsp. europaea TaxID=158383 RepID=A0A8S0UCM7_OLEEU|nr:Hypothetical predicted protein [Olea europaea subsp. europaea]